MNLLRWADHLDNMAVNLREDGSTVDIKRAQTLETMARKARKHNAERDTDQDLYVGTVWFEVYKVPDTVAETCLFRTDKPVQVFDWLLENYDNIIRLEVLPIRQYLSQRPRTVKFDSFRDMQTE